MQPNQQNLIRPKPRLSLQANPHKRLRHLYGSRMMTQYRNVALGELSPHVYAIAEQVGLTCTCTGQAHK